MRGGVHGWLLGAAIAMLVLAFPATALGAVRFAEPVAGPGTGDGPSDPALGGCPQADPCSLKVAVEGAVTAHVVDGDEVVVLPGPYNEAINIFAFDDIVVHGQAGQPRPLINSSAVTAFGANDPAGATFRRLEINHTGTNQAFQVFPGDLDDMIVRSQNGTACQVTGGSMTITNSVCWTQGDGDAAVWSTTGTTTTLRNVTAYATAPTTNSDGLHFSSQGSDTTTVNATNVIAKTTTPDAPSDDLEASASGSSTLTVTLDHSNYGPDVFENEPFGTTVTVTDPNTNFNQTTDAMLANPGSGDFHQLLGSLTIDAGGNDPANGTNDIDGDPRTVAGAGCPPTTDIGADELVPASPLDCSPPATGGGQSQPEPEQQAAPDGAPDTNITAGPTGRTKQRSATIEFNGTDARAVVRFECKLDDGPFETCTSPKTYTGLKKGDHTVQVRAIDDAGNVDPTPATRSWKVKKKKRRP